VDGAPYPEETIDPSVEIWEGVRELAENWELADVWELIHL